MRNSKFRNDKHRPTTISAIAFTDFIENQEATDASSRDYDNRIINAPSETTTPIKINEDKIEITFQNQSPGAKKAEEVVIEHHHHLNYYPKTKIKSLDEQTNKDERKVRLKNSKDDYHIKSKNDNRIFKPNTDLERKTNHKDKELKNLEEPTNQFELLESENKSTEKEVSSDNKSPRSSIVIDGLPGFPDPDLYLSRSSIDKSEFDKFSNRNKTDKLNLDNRNAELAADGAGFVSDAVGYRTNNDDDTLNRESSNREVSSYKENSASDKSSDKKDMRFIVKNPQVIWAAESDESTEEEQDVNNKFVKINRSLQPVFYKNNVHTNLRSTQSNAYKNLPISNIQHQHLTNTRLNSPSIKFVEAAVAESKQLNNKIPLIVSMHNNNLGKLSTILKTSSNYQPSSSFNNLSPQLLKSNFGLANERHYNPSFRLQTRRKREIANKNVAAGKDRKVYRIFSFNQKPINLTENKSTDLDTSSNVNVERNSQQRNERNKPLKTSNYNYNNINLYSPPNYRSNDKVNEDVSLDGKLAAEKLKEDKVGNSNENDYNSDNKLANLNPNGNINLKKSKPKKKFNNNRQQIRQPNFIEDNPFLNLFNTLTNIGQNSLSQALGQSNNLGTNNLGSNNLNSRASNEDEEEGGDDGNNINSNSLSTEKPKYGILGSGNYEIINGGIYKDLKAKNKINQPQQAFSTSDYSKDNSKEQLNNSYSKKNNSNLNNFQPFSFNDIPLLGFQGFDNFSKASKVNKSVIKKY